MKPQELKHHLMHMVDVIVIAVVVFGLNFDSDLFSKVIKAILIVLSINFIVNRIWK